VGFSNPVIGGGKEMRFSKNKKRGKKKETPPEDQKRQPKGRGIQTTLEKKGMVRKGMGVSIPDQ